MELLDAHTALSFARERHAQPISAELRQFASIEGLNPSYLNHQIQELQSEADELRDLKGPELSYRASRLAFRAFEVLRSVAPSVTSKILPWEQEYLASHKDFSNAPSEWDMAKSFFVNSVIPESTFTDIIRHAPRQVTRNEMTRCREQLVSTVDNYLGAMTKRISVEGVLMVTLTALSHDTETVQLVSGIGTVLSAAQAHVSADTYDPANVFRRVGRQMKSHLQMYLASQNRIISRHNEQYTADHIIDSGVSRMVAEIENWNSMMDLVGATGGTIAGFGLNSMTKTPLPSPVGMGIGAGILTGVWALARRAVEKSQWMLTHGTASMNTDLQKADAALTISPDLAENLYARAREKADEMNRQFKKSNQLVSMSAQTAPWLLSLLAGSVKTFGLNNQAGNFLLGSRLVSRLLALPSAHVRLNDVRIANKKCAEWLSVITQEAADRRKQSQEWRSSQGESIIPQMFTIRGTLRLDDGPLELPPAITIQPGITAIVAESGAGKTALLKAIRDASDFGPDVSIELPDGRDAKGAYPLEQWRAQFELTSPQIQTDYSLGLESVSRIMNNPAWFAHEFLEGFADSERPKYEKITDLLVDRELLLSWWNMMYDGEISSPDHQENCEFLTDCLVRYYQRFVSKNKEQTEIAIHNKIGSGQYASFGQSVRYGVGLAMLSDVPTYLVDEPTAGLDTKSKEQIIGVLARTILRHPEKSFVMTTHDEDLLYMLANVGHRGHPFQVIDLDRKDQWSITPNMRHTIEFLAHGQGEEEPERHTIIHKTEDTLVALEQALDDLGERSEADRFATLALRLFDAHRSIQYFSGFVQKDIEQKALQMAGQQKRNVTLPARDYLHLIPLEWKPDLQLKIDPSLAYKRLIDTLQTSDNWKQFAEGNIPDSYDALSEHIFIWTIIDEDLRRLRDARQTMQHSSADTLSTLPDAQMERLGQAVVDRINMLAEENRTLEKRYLAMRDPAGLERIVLEQQFHRLHYILFRQHGSTNQIRHDWRNITPDSIILANNVHSSRHANIYMDSHDIASDLIHFIDLTLLQFPSLSKFDAD